MRCHCQAAGDYRCWDLAPTRWKALTPSGLPLPLSYTHVSCKSACMCSGANGHVQCFMALTFKLGRPLKTC